MDRDERLKVGIFQGEGAAFYYAAIARVMAEINSFEPALPFVYGSAQKLIAAAKTVGAGDSSPLVHTRIQDIKGRKAQVVTLDDKNPDPDPFLLLQKVVEDVKNGSLKALITMPLPEENVRLLHPEFKNQALMLAKCAVSNPFRMLLCGPRMRVNFLTSVQRADSESYLSEQRISQRIHDISQMLKSDFSITTPRIAVLSADKNINARNCNSFDKENLQPILTNLFQEGTSVFGPFPAGTFLRSHELAAFDAVLCMYKEQTEVLTNYYANEDLRYYTAGLPVVHLEPFVSGISYEEAFRSLYRSVCVAIDIASSRMLYKRISENPLPYTSYAAKKGKDDEID